VHIPAAIQHGRPRIRQAAVFIPQPVPARLQLFERVLDDVFCGLNVTDHDDGQPDKGQVMFGEQRRHRCPGIRADDHWPDGWR
jgi:hypothetical protein